MMPRDVHSISDALIADDLGPDETAIDQQVLLGLNLDYSLQSLVRLETYLSDLHARGFSAIAQDDRFTATIFRAGAYVGEVIRRADPETWLWADDDFLTANPALSEIIGQPNLETALTLVGSGTAAWPVSKVIKYLEEGSDESVVAYAQWLLNMKAN